MLRLQDEAVLNCREDFGAVRAVRTKRPPRSVSCQLSGSPSENPKILMIPFFFASSEAFSLEDLIVLGGSFHVRSTNSDLKPQNRLGIAIS